jgi:uncharacterized membrane protein
MPRASTRTRLNRIIAVFWMNILTAGWFLAATGTAWIVFWFLGLATLSLYAIEKTEGEK